MKQEAQVNIRMMEIEKKQIQSLAKSEGKTVSHFVKDASLNYPLLKTKADFFSTLNLKIDSQIEHIDFLQEWFVINTELLMRMLEKAEHGNTETVKRWFEEAKKKYRNEYKK